MSNAAAASALDVTSELDFLDQLAAASGAEEPAQHTNEQAVAEEVPQAPEAVSMAKVEAALDTTAELAFLDQLAGDHAPEPCAFWLRVADCLSGRCITRLLQRWQHGIAL